MRYKELQVGDWYKYNGCYYIKSQKYTDFDFINVSLYDGNIININDNAEVEFVSCFFAIKTLDYVGGISFCATWKNGSKRYKYLYARYAS